MDEESDKRELARFIEQLMTERTDLFAKLEHLTRKYDECVRDINHDRSEMEYHNKHHAKLITAKIIFTDLQTIQNTRLQEAFREFKSYCLFDIKCHNKLDKLARVIVHVGRYRQKIALKQWFNKALKPVESKL